MLLLTAFASAQITTNPASIQIGYTGQVIITFNATGTSLAGQSEVYAHTGVITDASTGDADWKHAPAWCDNSAKYKLTSAGSNTWTLTISSIQAYYGTTASETVKKLAFVFRTKDGGTQTSDLFVVLRSSSDTARPTGVDEGIYYNSSDPSKVTLSLYAANKSGTPAKEVYVVGSFNNWTPSAAYKCKQDGNYFWIELTGLTSGQNYYFQYQVTKPDGTKVSVADPYSEMVLHPFDRYEPKSLDPTIPTYPSKADGGYVTVLQPGKAKYQWSSATTNFVKPNKNNLVIYELWVHNFAPERSYRSVTKRLDYLKNLGVNAVELMPVTEFDGNISWGYNPTMYFAPDKAYGSEKELKELIDECHKRGMAVILDMVINHTTGLNSQRKLYETITENPWFNQTAPHSDSVLEDWNHDFFGTQNYFKRALQYWINEYKVDGYRMDMSHGICGPNCNNRYNLICGYYDAVKSANSNAYFILEHWDEWSTRQKYVDKGMLCWTNTNNNYMQTAMGWLESGDNFNDANCDGYVTYCESHDEQRCFWKARKFGNGTVKTSESDRLARVPLNIAFNAMLNGPQMFYMFAELGYDYSFCTDGGGTYGDDLDKGSSGCKDTEEKPIPESKKWYVNSTRMAAYKKTAQIIQLRTRLLPQVFAGDPTAADLGSGAALRSITWGSGSNRVFIIGNFNVSGGSKYTGAKSFTLPSGNSWYDYLAGGTVPLDAGKSITLQPGEVKVYTGSKQTLPNVPSSYDFTTGITEATADAEKVCTVYPTITTDFVTVDTKKEIKNIYFTSLGGSIIPAKADANNVVETNSLSTGWYLLVVQFEDTEIACRIFKR